MHTQDSIFYQTADWHAVEGVGEALPQLDRVTALAFVEEAVDAVDGGALVVPAKEEEVIWVANLVG